MYRRPTPLHPAARCLASLLHKMSFDVAALTRDSNLFAMRRFARPFDHVFLVSLASAAHHVSRRAHGPSHFSQTHLPPHAFCTANLGRDNGGPGSGSVPGAAV